MTEEVKTEIEEIQSPESPNAPKENTSISLSENIGSKLIESAANGSLNEETKEDGNQIAEDLTYKSDIEDNYQNLIKNFTKQEITQYREILKNSSSETVRRNQQLLISEKANSSDEEKEKNIQLNSAAKLAIYAKHIGKGKYELNYKNVNPEHELTVGVQELFDASVEYLEIEKNGTKIIGKRGITQDGGIGYLDTKNKYIATFTGDIVTIPSEEKDYSGLFPTEQKDTRRLLEKYNEEEQIRKTTNYDVPKIKKPLEVLDYYVKYETDPAKYPPDYFKKTNRKGNIPVPIPDAERYVPMMGHAEALNYYENHVGKYGEGWKEKINVFGQNVKVNVVLGCMLLELEDRCKKMGMDINFNNMSSSNVEKSKRKGRTTFHGMAMAIDFDTKENWLGDPLTGEWNMPIALVQEAQKMGFRWGMYFHTGRADGKTDPMHWEYRGTIPDAMKQLRSPNAIALASSFKVPGKNMNLIDYSKIA